MKINELMVGDWVNIKLWDSIPTPSRVTAINYNSYLGEDYCDWVDLEQWDELSPSEIEPIPLTPEILEKNEWFIPNRSIWWQHDDISFYLKQYTNGEFEIYTDGESENSNLCCIKYVHQLQHALKLCGINKEIIV